MSLDEAWLAAQGEDAALLRAASTAFFFNKQVNVGVAVSGGSDSMAMLHLMARVAPQMGWSVHAVTVNHGLRPEAVTEAAFVASACVALGVPHATLQWQRIETTGNLQDQAARARYGLMAGWAQRHGITHVAVGHTADDQAENFVMRLARKSGIDGLSGMRREWDQAGVTFARPFLFHARAKLQAYLSNAGIGWMDDPSNENDRFARVRARKAMVHLQRLGISTTVLSDVSAHLSDARQALESYSQDIAHRIVICRKGDVTIDWLGLQTSPSEVQRRVMIAALRWVSGSEYPPRFAALQNLEMAIFRRKDKTLSGCRIVSSDVSVRIFREYKAVAGLSGPTDQIWDNRWQLKGPHDPGLQIGALGLKGLKACPDWRASGIPRLSLLSSPAVWQGDTLVAAPLAGFNDAWTARIVADFQSYLLSH